MSVNRSRRRRRPRRVVKKRKSPINPHKVLLDSISAVSQGLSAGTVAPTFGSMLSAAALGAGMSAVNQSGGKMITRLEALARAKERSRMNNKRVDIMRSLGAHIVACDQCGNSMTEPTEEEIALAGRAESNEPKNVMFIGNDFSGELYFICSPRCRARFKEEHFK